MQYGCKPEWEYSSTSYSKLTTRPLYDDGRIFYANIGADNYNIWAKDVNTGNMAVIYQVKDSKDTHSFTTAFALENGTLFAGDPFGNIYALDIQGVKIPGDGTGKIRKIKSDTDKASLKWKYKTQERIGYAKFLIDENRLIIANRYVMYCLNINSGKLLWERVMTNPNDEKETYIDADIYKGVLYYEASYRYWRSLYAIDASNGKKKWRKTISAYKGMHNNLMLIESKDDELEVFDMDENSVRWKFKPEEFGPINKFYVSNDHLYAGFSSLIYSINLDSGKVVWKTKVKSRVSEILALDDKLFVDASGSPYMLDISTGKTIWSHKLGTSNCDTRPQVYKDYLYFGCHKGLAAYDADTGEVVWKYKDNAPEYYVEESLFFIGDIMFFIDGSNGLISMK